MAQHSNYRPRETSSTTESGSISSPEGDDEEGPVDYEPDDDNLTLGDVIYEREIDTRTLPRSATSSVNRILNLDISDKLPEFKGIYHIMIRSAKDYWVRDSRFVSLSDIGMIAKEGKGEDYCFYQFHQDGSCASRCRRSGLWRQ